MYFGKLLLCIVLLTVCTNIRAQNVQLKSPDGDIVFALKLTKKFPAYRVVYKGTLLIDDSPLGLLFKETGSFGSNLEMGKPVFTEVKEQYDLIVGKAKTVISHSKQVVIPLREPVGARRKINIIVRAFNDGLAFRYEFPKQDGWAAYTLREENSSFNLRSNPTVHALFLGNYNTSHEGLYQKLMLSDVKPDTLMDLPTLFEFPGKVYMSITEANLRNYAGMYLVRKNGILTSQLSPFQGQSEIKVKATLPHQTPWRVMMISDRVGALIESNILTNLNEPATITDWSWLKPGKTSFHWWNGDVIPDTTIAPGVNFETNKYYIDFCAENNIEYHSVIGYGGFAWYSNNWVGYGSPGSYADVTRPVPGFDMQMVCDYAKKKGVGIHVWVHWKALYPQLDEAFAQFEKWGINGMMVDFLDRDDQEMVLIQEEILQKAAKHKLFIQFHGAYKPTGLHRTYPNEFTREGTHNYEHNKWNSTGVSPDHNVDIVFTRLLAGAADYHLGGFRAVKPSEFKTRFTRPLMIGTRCHMLAMYVVLESYLAMVADYPEAYRGQPGFDFLQTVPTTWDETRVLLAEVGEYVAITRRKGSDWYVGMITNSKGRTVNVALDFLLQGKYEAEVYMDAADSEERPNNLHKQTKFVQRGDVITGKLAAGGGLAIKIKKL